MKRISIVAKNRLLQVSGELISEGYRITGKLGDADLALNHTNGNRITLIVTELSIATIKNGRLVKSEPITITAAKDSA